VVLKYFNSGIGKKESAKLFEVLEPVVEAEFGVFTTCHVLFPDLYRTGYNFPCG